MKHDITTISSNDYINLINAEALPDTNEVSIKAYQVGGDIFVHLSSGIGSLTGPAISAAAKPKEIEAFLDAEIKRFTDMHKTRKDATESFEGRKGMGMFDPSAPTSF